MIKFIPLEFYYDVFIYFSFFLVLANLLHAYTIKLNDIKNIKFLRTAGYILLVLVIFYLGLRPISGRYFGDMGTYSEYFRQYANGTPAYTDKDVTFNYYMKTLSQIVSVHWFFLITESFYIVPMFLISKRYFKDYWFYAFFMFVVSFSFYT